MLEAAIYHLLKKHFRSESYYVDLLEIFHDVGTLTTSSHLGGIVDDSVARQVTFKTEMGQLIDLITAPEDDVDLSKFSFDKSVLSYSPRTSADVSQFADTISSSSTKPPSTPSISLSPSPCTWSASKLPPPTKQLSRSFYPSENTSKLRMIIWIVTEIRRRSERLVRIFSTTNVVGTSMLRWGKLPLLNEPFSTSVHFLQPFIFLLLAMIRPVLTHCFRCRPTTDNVTPPPRISSKKSTKKLESLNYSRNTKRRRTSRSTRSSRRFRKRVGMD